MRGSSLHRTKPKYRLTIVSTRTAGKISLEVDWDIDTTNRLQFQTSGNIYPDTTLTLLLIMSLSLNPDLYGSVFIRVLADRRLVHLLKIYLLGKQIVIH